ncbi:GNAT family N-acetyltransferase [Pseudolysinimonas sp.]|uniref:GNAT family N-acetyltransferase n=1 Tax=Pseudolysinimonas sp. TaxID=2680009 RepID=UPI003F7EAD00
MPVFRPAPVDDPAAQELLDEYFAMRADTFEGGEYRPTRPDPAAFAPPAGVFLLVTDDLGPVGCGGVRMLEPTRAEVKHLYLRDRARGRGWGRELLAELEARAVGLGARVVVLDTNATLEAAQGLYRSAGYLEVAAYNDNPNATAWFSKDLVV